MINNNNNFIKIGLIIGMIMSIILLISCIIYGIFTFFNYFSLVIILIIIYGLFQVIPFLLCLNNYFIEEKWLFLTGLFSLTTFVIPGVLILIGYFVRQKKIIKLINNN
ncbi:hypothetical protein [Spiroplasma endosymbiont of Colias croceus]|uniref:hypothetical protein n=1 Tax=Spiroplasma endosymbiont of Colias croceus TaxID=3066310 RepID=UPI0030D2FA47